jgi:hypothetical protein|tara:strand:- start:617 stop:922 length:306 start_codon:yes stop_codon:yes gene_type:complete
LKAEDFGFTNEELDEIDNVAAEFFKDEYFREERAGYTMTIYELVDLIHTKLHLDETTLINEKLDLLDKFHQNKYIRAVIYTSLVQISKTIYEHYLKNKYGK